MLQNDQKGLNSKLKLEIQRHIENQEFELAKSILLKHSNKFQNKNRWFTMRLGEVSELTFDYRNAIYWYLISLIHTTHKSLDPVSRVRKIVKEHFKEINEYFILEGSYLPLELLEIFKEFPHPKISLCSNIKEKQVLFKRYDRKMKLIDHKNDFAEYERKASAVYKIKNGIAYSDQSTSAIFSENGSLYFDLSSGASIALALSDLPINLSKFDGGVAYLSTRWGSSNYYHWVTYTIPKIYLLKNSKFYNEIQYFAFNAPLSEFNIKYLNAVGITEDQIIDTQKIQWLTADNIYIADQPLTIIEPWGMEYLKSIVNPKVNDKLPKRIYVKRSNKRYIENSHEFEAFILQFGFSVLEMDNYTIKEQAEIFMNATHIISPHGANLTSIVFTQKNATLLEIFSPLYLNACYEEICFLKSIKYYRYIGLNGQKNVRLASNTNINIDTNSYKWKNIFLTLLDRDL